jgi:hypothetical protein
MIEGELERSDEDLGHGSPVSPTSRPVATAGANAADFGLFGSTDQKSRENYVWLVRTQAERRGIGWAYWDDGGQFKAMDPRTATWNEGLRRALLDK